MKIPSMPKGLIGMPLFLVIGGVAVYYFFIKIKMEKIKKVNDYAQNKKTIQNGKTKKDGEKT